MAWGRQHSALFTMAQRPVAKLALLAGLLLLLHWSHSELRGQHAANLAKFFQSVDTDGDGQIESKSRTARGQEGARGVCGGCACVCEAGQISAVLVSSHIGKAIG